MEEAGPTVGVTDNVCLRVGLPQDAVTPGGDVGPHLGGEMTRVKMKMEVKKRRWGGNSPQSPSASATRRCLWSRARSGTSAGRRSPPPLQAKSTHHHLFSCEGGAPPTGGLD